jgi:hypothetical protein
MFPTISRPAAFDRLAALATGILFASALSASALTITPGPMPVVAELNPIADASTGPGAVFENVTGSVSGVRRSPWEGTALAATGVYSSVSGNATATYQFSGAMKSVSFLWGSPDTYNDLDFVLGGSVVGTVNGAAIQPPVAVGAKYVTLSGVGAFDSVIFKSSQNAFEFANLTTTAVPLPAAVFLLGGAVAGLGALRRRAS